MLWCKLGKLLSFDPAESCQRRMCQLYRNCARVQAHVSSSRLKSSTKRCSRPIDSKLGGVMQVPELC